MMNGSLQFRGGKEVQIDLCIFLVWLPSGHKEMRLSVSILFPLSRGTIREAAKRWEKFHHELKDPSPLPET